MELAASKKVPVDDLILSLDMSMATIGKTFKKDIDSVALGNFTTFNTQMKRLSDMASPFERFTKAFTQFSKDMGTFSKNFKVMTPEGIDAYKVWTDAVVTVAKTDFSLIESKIQAMRDIAASIYKAGDDEIPNGDNEQTEQQKQEAIKNKNNNVVTSPDPNSQAGGGGGGGADGAAIASAIKSALQGMSIGVLKVGSIQDSLLPSDRRLKENIVHVGTSPSGIAIYEWKYIGIPGRYRGVMAQDLLETEHADAVIMVDGFYRVNYAKLDVKFRSI